jgi:hypothetical protein
VTVLCHRVESLQLVGPDDHSRTLLGEYCAGSGLTTPSLRTGAAATLRTWRPHRTRVETRLLASGVAR